MPLEIVNKIIASAVSLIFLAMAIFFIAVSLILEHHWRKYGLKSIRFGVLRSVYYFGSLILLTSMLISAYSYFKFLAQ